MGVEIIKAQVFQLEPLNSKNFVWLHEINEGEIPYLLCDCNLLSKVMIVYLKNTK